MEIGGILVFGFYFEDGLLSHIFTFFTRYPGSAVILFLGHVCVCGGGFGVSLFLVLPQVWSIYSHFCFLFSFFKFCHRFGFYHG